MNLINVYYSYMWLGSRIFDSNSLVFMIYNRHCKVNFKNNFKDKFNKVCYYVLHGTRLKQYYIVFAYLYILIGVTNFIGIGGRINCIFVGFTILISIVSKICWTCDFFQHPYFILANQSKILHCKISYTF